MSPVFQTHAWCVPKRHNRGCRALQVLQGVTNSSIVASPEYTERLIQAAADDDVSTVRILIASGLDPNCADYDHRTALHLAVCRNSRAVLDLLLSLPALQLAPVDRMGHTPLWEALLAGNHEVAHLLREAGARVQDDVSARLCQAAARNDAKFFAILADVDVGLLARVRATCWLSHLLRASTQFACWDRRVLTEGERWCCRLQDPDGRTALHVAASRGCLEVASTICRACGRRVNPVDVQGATPLDNARQQQCHSIVALLLECGGLPGSHPSCLAEHARVVEWARACQHARVTKRKEAILERLPERTMARTAAAINEALRDFVAVRTPRRHTSMLDTPVRTVLW